MRRNRGGRGEKSPWARIARSALWILIFSPAAFGFVYVWLYGVDVPYNDDWKMVPLFENLSSGTLSLADLFAQQNEHRVLFPRIAMLMLGAATAFDTVAVMYLGQICLLLTLIALLLAFKSSVSPNALYFVPVPFLIFGLGQYWNMLQAFQIALIFAQAFGVLALYLLYVSRRERFRRFALPGALASGTVATFSAAPGLAVWPAGLPLLLALRQERRARSVVAGAWGLAGLAETTIYFLGYSEPPDHTSSRYLIERSTALPRLLLTMLGGSLFREQDSALAAGMLLALLAAAALTFAFLVRRAGECSFWMSLLIFSLLTLAATTLARGGSGIENALNSKYVTYSVLAVTGVYAILARSALDSRTPLAAALFGTLTMLVAWSIPLSYAHGIERGKEIAARKERAAFVVATYETQPDGALGLLKRHFRASPETGRERVSTLEALGYSVFSGRRPEVLPPPLAELTPVSSATRYGIDAVDRKGDFIRITGWAVDEAAADVAGGVYVVVDGKPFPAFYGTRSESVAERLGDTAFEHSGFERDIPVSGIRSGKPELSVIVVANDGKRCYLPDRETTLEAQGKSSALRASSAARSAPAVQGSS